jgi:hypothetical protein
MGACTNDEDISEVFTGIPATETFAAVQNQAAIDGYSTIMMHPQEFTVTEGGLYTSIVNETQIKELVKLIQMVKSAGSSF